MSQRRSVARVPEAGLSLPTTPFSEAWLRSLRRAIGEVNGRPVLMAGTTVTTAELSQISALREKLQAALSVGNDHRRQVAMLLGEMLAAFPAQPQDPGVADLRMHGYFASLDDIPAWAIAEAKDVVLAG